jgi:hypothetical protein
MPATKVRASQLKSSSIGNTEIAADAAIALSKLATNPLARANHTGTQATDTLTETSTAKVMTGDERTKLAGIEAAATANSSDATLKARANHTGSQAISTVTGLQAALDAKQASDEKGEPNGYAELDGDGKIPAAQLPDVAITDTFVVANQSAMLALTAQVGDVAVRTDESKTYILKTAGASTLGNWQLLQTPTAAVSSVHARTGAVTAQSGDYNAGQVDVTPAGNLASDNVQDALEELQADVDGLAAGGGLSNSHFVDRETPSGDVDGSNVEFALSNTPLEGSEHVFLNGLLQDDGSGNDYTIDGDTITFEAAPLTGDKVRVSYRK